MRKIFAISLVCIFCLAGSGAVAQNYVGAKVGYGGGTVRIYPPQDTKYIWGYKNFGVSWKYYSAERVIGAVQVDLEFMQRGYGIANYGVQSGSKTDTTYVRGLSSINVPFSWHPHIYFFRRHLRVFLNLGVNLSYNFDSNEKKTLTDGTVIFNRPRPMYINRDNRFGYGLSGGFGFGMLFGRMEYFVEGRYYVGYSDILKNHNIYYTNPVRSELDNINVSFGVFYRLGKGGIKSPTQAQINARRAQRSRTQFQKMDQQ